MYAIQRKKQSKSSLKRWVPHKYQGHCVERGIRERHLGLLLDPGLGKTTISLQIFKRRKYSRSPVNAMLVVAPLRPCFLVWPKETRKWRNFKRLSVGVLHNDWGQPKEKTLKEKHDIYVINPAGLGWLLQQLKGKRRDTWPFQMLVVDESTKFKNMGSQQFKNIKKLIPGFYCRYILTGTPTPNGLMNIQGQFYIIDQGETFGQFKTHFQRDYCKRIGNPEWNQWEVRKDKVDDIHRKAAKFAIRMEAKDYLDLPEKINNFIEVKLPRNIRKQYDSLEKEFFAEFGNNEINATSGGVKRLKLRQIANGAIYEDLDPLKSVPKAGDRKYIDLHNEKLDALEDLIDELEGKPLLVGYSFKHDLIKLKKRFGKDLVTMDGASMKQAAKIESDWNKGKIKILALYPGTSALGLNLQESGNDVCWFSLTDDLEAYIQFILRILRQGVKGKHVRVHHIIARDTVDEVMLYQLGLKDDIERSFLDAVKKYQQKLI